VIEIRDLSNLCPKRYTLILNNNEKVISRNSANAKMYHLESTIARLKLKGLGGFSYNAWYMQFNSIIRE